MHSWRFGCISGRDALISGKLMTVGETFYPLYNDTDLLPAFAVTAAVVITAFSAAILATAKRFARHLWDLSIADVQSAENQKVGGIINANLLCVHG